MCESWQTILRWDVIKSSHLSWLNEETIDRDNTIQMQVID